MSTFIGWYDPSKRTLQSRLENAIEIFEERRGYRPALVLVNDEQIKDIAAPDGVELGSRHHIAADTFWLEKR